MVVLVFFVWLCGFHYGAYLALLFVFVFFSPFCIVITALGEERELAYVLLVHLFVHFARVDVWPFFSPSWCQRLAAACDCGTPWTFLLTFFYLKLILMVHRVLQVRFSLPLDIRGWLRLVTVALPGLFN